VVRRMSVQGV